MAIVERLDAIPDSSGFDPVPAGAYHVKIEKATEKKSGENAKHPDGGYFNLQLNIESGEFAGRKLFMPLAFHTGCKATNCDPKPLLGMLKSTLRAFGFTDAQFAGSLDLSEQNLLSREAIATVKVGTNRNTGEPNNEVKGVKPLDSRTLSMP